MLVLAWMVGLCVVLVPLGWLCDHWPTEDERSVDRFEVFRDRLGGDR